MSKPPQGTATTDRKDELDQAVLVSEAFGFDNAENAEAFIENVLANIELGEDVIVNQPVADATPSEMLRSARDRGAHHAIESLLRMIDKKGEIPFRHLGRIKWLCEMATDEKLKDAKAIVQFLLKDAFSNDPFESKFAFSSICQKYKDTQRGVELEKEVIWMGEAQGIAFVLSGAVVLAVTSGYGAGPIVAGLFSTLIGGVCAGAAEAHHGNLMRVHDVGVNHEECIRLLAGDSFLKELRDVKTNEEFKGLFSRHEIPFRNGLRIIEDDSGMSHRANTILGRNVVAPQSGTQLAGESRSGGNCTVS
jgi:hypothetical protein